MTIFYPSTRLLSRKRTNERSHSWLVQVCNLNLTFYIVPACWQGDFVIKYSQTSQVFET
ncbi:hypothetical protein KsCSTR_00710 [Candidatus Kuenenia stuttgartiensis]|uniref:Uncharacterized protein n=1 Tax=Kuenenia stuttgartiensis TaxID=174633 RepID=Q1PV68_KUEST|nr:hypothetical protein KsCSTR_00710 [Candidatus Kuenenia stuttgartiensis]CAJ71123.1 unknown protein [Candidatus Kuenenia stuttgartiensis]